MTEVFECVIFEANENSSRGEFVSAAEASMDWAAEQPGFLSRELFEVTDGRWIDTVRWATMDDAMAASSAIGEAPAMSELVARISGSSVQMMHAHRVANR